MTKNNKIAGILAIFLGGLGVHYFYLGEKKKGFIQLASTIICIALWIISLSTSNDFLINTITPVLFIVIPIICITTAIRLFTNKYKIK